MFTGASLQFWYLSMTFFKCFLDCKVRKHKLVTVRAGRKEDQGKTHRLSATTMGAS